MQKASEISLAGKFEWHFVTFGLSHPSAAAVTATRSTFKIEDPSLGPGRFDSRAPDGGFRLKGGLGNSDPEEPLPNNSPDRYFYTKLGLPWVQSVTMTQLWLRSQ